MTIERFGDALKRVVKVPSFQERYEKMRRDTLEDPDVQQFFSEQNLLIHFYIVRYLHNHSKFLIG